MEQNRLLPVSAEELQEFEFLRGKPVQRLNWENIPCQELSSPERLCSRPIVSVHMITYNHEKYIAKAIESVVSQETDFAFELVIGEDCSTDGTRKIALEYQKRYPEIIRLLISEKNVGAKFNSVRTVQHCRGEFIAYCEGDDYWIDKGKLQLQYHAFLKNPNAGIVHSGGIFDAEGTFSPIEKHKSYQPATKRESWEEYVGFSMIVTTCSAMVRKEIVLNYLEGSPLAKLSISLSDYSLWLDCLRQRKEILYLEDKLVAYRANPTSVMRSNFGWILCSIDAKFIAYHYAQYLDKIYSKRQMIKDILDYRLLQYYHTRQPQMALEIFRTSLRYKVFLQPKNYLRLLYLLCRRKSALI